MNDITLEKLITIDNSGLPKPPSVTQILDRDIRDLFVRDKTHDKSKYIAEAGFIYFMGDPNSPVMQQGLDEKEALKYTIENFNLPRDYKPDPLVAKLVKRYYDDNMGPAGVTLEALQKSLRLSSKAAVKINEILSNKLENITSDEDISLILKLMSNVEDMIKSLPAATNALKLAYENLKSDREEKIARGGKNIQSSMIAD